MRDILIVALVCLNVALVITLVLGSAEPAKAQNEYYRPSNYTMVTGKMSSGNEVLYIVDMASQRLGACAGDCSITISGPAGREGGPP
jgi:hypothetical protein